MSLNITVNFSKYVRVNQIHQVLTGASAKRIEMEAPSVHIAGLSCTGQNFQLFFLLLPTCCTCI